MIEEELQGGAAASMPELVVRGSWRFYSLMLFVSVFVPAAAAYTEQAPTELVWMSRIILLAIPAFAWKLLDRRPILTISDAGIHDRRMGGAPIPLGNIESAGFGQMQHMEFLCLTLRDREAYLRTLGRTKRAAIGMNRSLGFGDYHVMLADIKIDRDRLMDLIRSKIALHSPPEAISASAAPRNEPWRAGQPIK